MEGKFILTARRSVKRACDRSAQPAKGETAGEVCGCTGSQGFLHRQTQRDGAFGAAMGTNGVEKLHANWTNTVWYRRSTPAAKCGAYSLRLLVTKPSEWKGNLNHQHSQNWGRRRDLLEQGNEHFNQVSGIDNSSLAPLSSPENQSKMGTFVTLFCLDYCYHFKLKALFCLPTFK